MRLKVLILGFILCACGEKTDQQVLSKAEMADWMMELYLSEARAMSLGVELDSAYRVFLPHQDSVLKRMGIQDSTLKRSYQYYLSRPEELEAIYDIVIDSLSLREQRARSNQGR